MIKSTYYSNQDNLLFFGMTLRELLTDVPFNDVLVCQRLDDDPIRLAEELREAWDILLNLPVQKGEKEDICITEEEDLVTHKKFLYAYGCEGEKWSLFIDSPIFVPDGVKLEKPMAAYIILSALTYWGVTPE